MMENLENRFKYHKPDAGKVKRHEAIRTHCGALATLINVTVPDCREKSLAITKIEEAMMWANAALARNP